MYPNDLVREVHSAALTRVPFYYSNRYRQARKEQRLDNETNERRIQRLLEELEEHKEAATRHKAAHDEKQAELERIRDAHSTLQVFIPVA